MDVKLVVKSGKNAGREIPITVPRFIVGRGEDCQLRPNSDQVSRQHCAIVASEGMAILEDFGSKNGTYVNDQRVQGKRELKTGDVLKIANLEFEVRLIVDVGGRKKPKITNIQEAAARTVESAADDLDVSEWLVETERAEEDTQTLLPQQTAQIKRPVASNDSPVEKKKIFEAPQADKKPKAANSGQAAADVLRKLFNQ